MHRSDRRGLSLESDDVDVVNQAAKRSSRKLRRFIAYDSLVKVGGSFAWRANNPGNLRNAPTKIGSVPGASGVFAVFSTMDEGRAAQRSLYENTYGNWTVNDAIQKLTPPSENDTPDYLKKLQAAGIDLNKDVKSQIVALMASIQVNEGMITGIEVVRLP